MPTITQLSQLYANAPSPEDHPVTVAAAWLDAGDYFRREAARLTTSHGLSVLLTPNPEPYETAADQAIDMRYNHTLNVSTAHCDHPHWDPMTNVAYRIVHDVTGHGTGRYGTVHPFTVAGELAAWDRHLSTMLDHSVRRSTIRVAFCETVLQLAYAATTGDFHPTQPCTLAPSLGWFDGILSTITDDRGPTP